MLKEIICDQFRDGKIKFKNGLNVIQGDNKATNSIGKTTILMIIDFVFGGSSYITLNNDSVINLGNHSFKFSFEFDGEEMYFERSTNNYMFVSICDGEYNFIDEISIDEYKTILTKKFNLSFLGNHFRSIVGGYSRIWGKDNYDVTRPLKQKDSKVHEAIIGLIKLFDKYKNIESLEVQNQKINDRKQAISKAINNDLIPSINKKDYIDNNNKIFELQKKITRFMDDINDFTLDVETLASEEVMEIRKQKNILVIKRNKLNNRLLRLENNLNNEELKVTNKLNKIIDFFPTINQEKLLSINEFHKNLSRTLKSEIKLEKDKLEKDIEILNSDIIELDKLVEKKINVNNKSNYNIERLADLINQKRSLEDQNSIYEKKEKTKKDLEELKNDLIEIKQKLLSDISNQINIKMYELNKIIYEDNRKSPVFALSTDNYDLSRPNDTGTGTCYINLISFDLAIFKLTDLPFIIHDSILFKNIQLKAFDNLLKVYNSFSKQIFIAIDEINRFSKESQILLNDKAVLKLNINRTLFIKNWKLEN